MRTESDRKYAASEKGKAAAKARYERNKNDPSFKAAKAERNRMYYAQTVKYGDRKPAKKAGQGDPKQPAWFVGLLGKK